MHLSGINSYTAQKEKGQQCAPSHAAFYAPGEPKTPRGSDTPKRVTLTGFIAAVARIEVCIHRCSHRCTNKVLQAVRYVSGQEESIRIGQIMVDRVTFWDRTVIANRIQIVISSSDTTFGFKQTSCNKLKIGWDYQLTRTCRNQQTTLISPTSDLDNGGFQRSLVKSDAVEGLFELVPPETSG